MILTFIVCLGLACPPWGMVEPRQETSPVVQVDAPDQAQYHGNGNPFVGIGPTDTGYCGEDMSGHGWSGSLLWPLESHTINENRHFRVGHTGIDINGSVGQSVYSAAPGRVVFAGWSTWGFGNLVVLSHGGGWMTFYAHMSDVTVACGMSLGAGQELGYVGRSGAATWPHLHFEVRNGRTSYDPLRFL